MALVIEPSEILTLGASTNSTTWSVPFQCKNLSLSPVKTEETSYPKPPLNFANYASEDNAPPEVLTNTWDAVPY